VFSSSEGFFIPYICAFYNGHTRLFPMSDKIYRLSDFDFNLPENLIAQQPVSPRDYAKLLVYDRATATIEDRYFYELKDLLAPNTTMVLNNSKVEKCRMRFGKMEVFITNALNPNTIEAMVNPGRKFKLGNTVILNEQHNLTATVIDIAEDGIRRLAVNPSLEDAAWDKFRLTPLPPYIEQDESLADEYQTVYAKPLGSKAAPTAGLHFTDELLAKIGTKHTIAELTLHVGLGTFAPVKEEEIAKHAMHSESYHIDEMTAEQLNQAQHITAIGTTSARTLESAVLEGRHFEACSGDTELYITPGYEYKAVNSLVTNFHLPKSTLLMLVSALMGFDEMHRVYQHAIRNNYRFYSFGDAMFIK
jgi:S-adenosylmethionine:tRNA ribosyltransferase-isomerase